MPELPEVETIRRTLEPKLLGRTITGGEVMLPKMLINQTPEDFLRQVTGRKIIGLNRRGKYLLFSLTDELSIAIHLRMTGQLVVEKLSEPQSKATYLKLRLDNETELRFRDQRKFGKVFSYDNQSIPQVLCRLGPEPLSPKFNLPDFRNSLAARGLAIKKLLLDQHFIVGLGNIYTDEALFVAGIHPARPAGSLNPMETERLFEAIRQVLTEGIKYRGTTKRDYLDGEGKPGEYQEHLRVYGRKGQPCFTCNNTISKINFGGRGTHFCPQCQK